MSQDVHYDLSIPGWMTEPELQWLYQTASQMSSVVEIGCYQGRSTFALLQGCKGPVYAIDPWIDIMSNRDNNLKLFLANIGERIGINRYVSQLRALSMPSSQGVVALQQLEPRGVDMVFIDGDHEYSAVLQDIDLWRPKTRKLLCGHDFGNGDWPGVTKAVQERFGAGQFSLGGLELPVMSNPVGLIWSVQVG